MNPVDTRASERVLFPRIDIERDTIASMKMRASEQASEPFLPLAVKDISRKFPRYKFRYVKRRVVRRPSKLNVTAGR